MYVFPMNRMGKCINSGSAVRTTCDMKKEATPETLCTLLHCFEYVVTQNFHYVTFCCI